MKILFTYRQFKLNINRFQQARGHLNTNQSRQYIKKALFWPHIYLRRQLLLDIKQQNVSFDLQYLGLLGSEFFFINSIHDDRFVYFCVFDIFYKIDLLTKELKNLTTINVSINMQPLDQVINFYRLDESQYFKKSENIKDSKNMIIVKSQQEDNIYIGKTQQGDSQYHFFQTQNDFYWHNNLFNNSYCVLNLKVQSQIFLAQQLDNNQNWIVMYDMSSNQIIIYNATECVTLFYI
ncbi:hypothetical protein ABPG72_011397 [Tetrahymena utriculariae]